MRTPRIDRDILQIVQLFGPQHEPAGVPHEELLSQLHLLGHWPGIKRNRRINIKVYARAERELQEALDRLVDAGLIVQPHPALVSITEAGDAASRD